MTKLIPILFFALAVVCSGDVILATTEEFPVELYPEVGASEVAEKSTNSISLNALLAGSAGDPTTSQYNPSNVLWTAYSTGTPKDYSSEISIANGVLVVGDVDELLESIVIKAYLDDGQGYRAGFDKATCEGDIEIKFPVPDGSEQTNSYPVGFKTLYEGSFDAGTVVSNGAPVIYEWTRTANGGDTIAFTGENIDSDTEFFIQSSQKKINRYLATPQLIGDNEFAITLKDAAFVSDTLTFLVPRNANGYGKSIPINKAEAWWVGPDTVATGETFSVYGRNLDLGNDNKADLYIDGYGWVNQTASNPYKVDFVCPALAEGDHTIYIHNGHGGKYGWSDALTLTVAAATDWSAGSNRVVSTASELTSAISASSSGDTVTLSAGTYEISSHIQCGNGIRLVGNGVGSTIIKPASGYTHSGNSSQGMINFGSNNEVDSIEFQSASSFYSAGGQRLLQVLGKSNNKFIDCKFTEENLGKPTNASDQSLIKFGSTAKNAYFTNCTFVVSTGVFIEHLEGGIFDDCAFYGMWDINGIVIHNAYSKQLSFFNCTAGNFDESSLSDGGYGWMKRWVNGENLSYVYFGDNVTSNILPRLDPLLPRSGSPDQNSGEQILFEKMAANYYGTLSSIAGTTLTFNSTIPLDGKLYVKWGSVTITDGKGFGQSRRITDISGAVVTIDKAFDVEPDTSSQLSVGRTANHVVVYNNTFDGRPRGPEEQANTAEQNASCAVSLYGGAFNCIIDNNTATEVTSGFVSRNYFEQSDAPENGSPTYFNIFQNNTVDYCFTGIERTSAGGSYSMVGPMQSCNIDRNNTITRPLKGSYRTGKGYAMNENNAGAVENNIVENNSVTTTNSSIGFSLSPSALSSDNAFIGNTADGVAAP